MNIVIVIAAFLFSIPIVGKRAEKKYNLLFKGHLDEMKKVAEELKNINKEVCNEKCSNAQPPKDDKKWN